MKNNQSNSPQTLVSLQANFAQLSSWNGYPPNELQFTTNATACLYNIITYGFHKPKDVNSIMLMLAASNKIHKVFNRPLETLFFSR